MKKLPIIFVAPTKKQAIRALSHLNIPHREDQPIIAIGNRGWKDLEGVVTTRDRIHLIGFHSPWDVSYREVALRYACREVPGELE